MNKTVLPTARIDKALKSAGLDEEQTSNIIGLLQDEWDGAVISKLITTTLKTAHRLEKNTTIILITIIGGFIVSTSLILIILLDLIENGL